MAKFYSASQMTAVVRYAPSHGWDRYTLQKVEDTIYELRDYLDSLKVGTKLDVGSLLSDRYDPWRIEKVSKTNWKGFVYDWDDGIKSLDMAETMFHHLKATHYPIIKEVKED